MNRQPVRSLADLHAALDKLRLGDAIVLQVERRGALVLLVFSAD